MDSRHLRPRLRTPSLAMTEFLACANIMHLQHGHHVKRVHALCRWAVSAMSSPHWAVRCRKPAIWWRSSCLGPMHHSSWHCTTPNLCSAHAMQLVQALRGRKQRTRIDIMMLLMVVWHESHQRVFSLPQIRLLPGLAAARRHAVRDGVRLRRNARVRVDLRRGGPALLLY